MELLGQELIVVTTSATDTMAMLIKDHAWNENQINRTFPGIRLGLRNAQTAFTHHVLAIIRTHLHRAAMGICSNWVITCADC